ncbi:hypothetical protein K439DRAFT_1625661 [Ramaria rubella]|nr:hypothetical protein K439DRAFT_1625661 [Ramaria rubella]
MPLPSRSKATSKKDKRKSKGVSLQGGGMTMSILELLQHIVNEDAPKLTPEEKFPSEATTFVNSCLLKDPDARPAPKDLLKHEWIDQSRSATIDLEGWANMVAPRLLRGNGVSTIPALGQFCIVLLLLFSSSVA